MKSQFSHKCFFLFVLCLAVSLGFGQAHAQEPKIIYVYDDLGRLSRVVDQNNDCATYEYDAVGNILSITRSANCLQPPTVDSLSLDTARAGETACITITGSNFLGATVTTDNPEVQISRVRVFDTRIEVCLIISALSPVGPTRIIVSTPGGVAERLFTIDPRLVVLTQNTTIGPTDLRFELLALTIAGPVTVTIDGAHRFASLTLQNSAVVTHSATTNTATFSLNLTVDRTLAVDATSKVDVTGRGFLGGAKPGNPFGDRGMTLGFAAGSTNRNGGSYGGIGGLLSGTVNQVYGDFRDPNEPGSGGGAHNAAAGSGGGLIRIVAQTLQLDGIITANGENAISTTDAGGGGGSGGGIRIDIGTLQGTGTINANGGNGGAGDGGGAGGGGGRVAVYYETPGNFNLASQLTAAGGAGGAAGVPGGQNGSVFSQQQTFFSP